MDGTGHGNPDRGWNDPPKLAFSASTGTRGGPGRHRLLNKRVPIPVNPQGSNAPSSLPPSLKASDGPPVMGNIPPHLPPVSSCPPSSSTSSMVSASGADNTEATQELLEQVQTSLSDSLKAVSEKLKESTHEEIRKRLDVMGDMWQKGQLSLEVQKRMLALSEALSKQNFDKAWALHQSLIVDYTTTCSPWMVGIKSLIAESRSHSETVPEQDELTDKSDKMSEAEQDSVLDDDKEDKSDKKTEAEQDSVLDGDKEESSFNNESSVK